MNYRIDLKLIQDVIEKRTGNRPNQQEVGKIAGVTQKTVSNMNSGKIPIGVRALINLREVTGLSIDQLIVKI